jgi:hypothetical protein
MACSLSNVRSILSQRTGYALCQARHYRLRGKGNRHGIREGTLADDEKDWLRQLKVTEAAIMDPSKTTEFVRLMAKNIISEFNLALDRVFSRWEKPDDTVAPSSYHLVAETLDLAFCRIPYLSAFIKDGTADKFARDPIGWSASVAEPEDDGSKSSTQVSTRESSL